MPDATLTAVLQLRDEMSSGLTLANRSLNQLQETFKKVEKETKNTSNTLSAMRNATIGMANSIAQATGLIKLFSLGTLINEMKRAIQQSIQLAGHIDRVSKITGIAAASVQKYEAAFETAGISAGGFEAIIRILQLRTQEAIDGNEEAQRTFVRLGIGMGELGEISGDTERLFRRVIDALAKVEDRALRMKLGNEVMGRSFSRMSGVLATGTKTIDAYGKALQKAGGIIPEESQQKIDIFGDKLEALGKVWGGLKAQMTLWLSDALEPTLRGFFSFARTVNDARAAIELLGNRIGIEFQFIKEVAIATFERISNIVDAFIKQIQSTFNVLITLKENIIAALSPIESPQKLFAIAKIGAAINEAAQSTGEVAKTIGQQSISLANDYLEIVKKLEAAQTKGADKIIADNELRKQSLNELEKGTLDLLKTVEQVNKESDKGNDINNSSIAITSGLSKAMDDYKKKLADTTGIFTNLFNAMQGAFSTAIEGMLSGGKKFKDVMKGFFTDIKKAFIKMIADMIAQRLMAGLLGGLGSLGGGTPQTIQPSQGAQGGTTFVAGGGFNLAGLAGLAGSIGLGATANAAGQGQLSPAAGGISGGASAALLAAGLGAGPLGVLAAGLGGLLGGGLLSSKGKKDAEKAKEAAEQQVEEAQEELEAQRNEARRLILLSTRTQLGGGLASTEAADAVSNLFSGGISDQEIQEFGGAANVLARKGEIEGLAGNKVITIGAPVINVSVGQIASSYDAALLAKDLGFLLGSSIQSSLGNA